jgi:hypothetical protein
LHPLPPPSLLLLLSHFHPTLLMHARPRSHSSASHPPPPLPPGLLPRLPCGPGGRRRVVPRAERLPHLCAAAAQPLQPGAIHDVVRQGAGAVVLPGGAWRGGGERAGEARGADGRHCCM